MKLDLFLSLPVKFNKTLKVNCKIFSKDKLTYQEGRVIIDTGASTTSLYRMLLEKLLGYGNIVKGTTEKYTATGLTCLDTVVLSRIEIGGELAFNNVGIDVLEWTETAILGVIGMDILSRLHFHSDTKNFYLQSKPFFTRYERLQ